MDNQSIYQFLKDSVSCYPEYDILTYYGRKFSKADFFTRVDSVAAYLKEKGVKAGDSVGICLPNIPEAVIAIYAVSKIGGIINVIHPLMPAKGMRGLLLQTNTKYYFYLDICYENSREVLNDGQLVPILCSIWGFMPALIKKSMAVAHTSSRKRLLKMNEVLFFFNIPYADCGTYEGSGEDVALYLHSGGTTGFPKTIMISNKALNNNAIATCRLVEGGIVPAEDAMLMVLPLFHGFGFGSSMHGILSGGGRGILTPRFNAKECIKLIKKYRITILTGVPNMYKKLLSCKAFHRKFLANIKDSYCGGDVLPVEIKNKYDNAVAIFGGRSKLLQGYGLAETIAVCCANTLFTDRAGTIGYPVENAKLMIMNDDKKPCEIQEKGEICVATSSMMKGYYGDEITTSEVTFVDKDGERWLRTGDIGYMDADKYFYFSGRKKRIIIIGGINIFPVEIEEIVNGMDEIDVSCAVENFKNNKNYIKLFVKLNKGYVFNDTLKSKIITLLSANLIRYSIPREIVCLRDFPYTAVGKIDYKALESNIVHQNV